MESAWVNLGVYLCIQGKQQPLKASSSMHHHLPLLLYWRAGGCKLSPQLALSSGNRKKKKKKRFTVQRSSRWIGAGPAATTALQLVVFHRSLSHHKCCHFSTNQADRRSSFF